MPQRSPLPLLQGGFCTGGRRDVLGGQPIHVSSRERGAKKKLLQYLRSDSFFKAQGQLYDLNGKIVESCVQIREFKETIRKVEEGGREEGRGVGGGRPGPSGRSPSQPATGIKRRKRVEGGGVDVIKEHFGLKENL
ncbi:hypothetical protein AAC387_Pa06g2013 [Persea americana]